MQLHPKIFLCVFLLQMLAAPAWGAYISNLPMAITQPDGTRVSCLASGDEIYSWLHDSDGFTIGKNSEGWYVYVARQGETLACSDAIVGKDRPREHGLTPYANVSENRLRDLYAHQARYFRQPDVGRRTSPVNGTMHNIVIYVRFQDQLTEFTDPQGNPLPSSHFGSVFNGLSGLTLQNYYKDVSYDSLNVQTQFFPTSTTGSVVSYQESAHNRNYYRPNVNGNNPEGYSTMETGMTRIQDLLRNAVASVMGQIPNDPLNYDLDVSGDNLVDNVSLIIMGTSEESPIIEVSQGVYLGAMLWSHRNTMSGDPLLIHNVQVGAYTVLMQDQLNSTSGLATAVHELFHTFGAPDLYKYNVDANADDSWNQTFGGVGTWDIMCRFTDVPQHMSSYAKWKYGGWLDIPTVTGSQTISLQPANAARNCAVKIDSANAPSEFYILEYRVKQPGGTFDGGIPGSGLLVYRIDENVAQGNQNSPPYNVYLFRLNGSPTQFGDINNAHLGYPQRASFNAATNPYPFLTSGVPDNLDISDISSAQSTLSFTLNQLSSGHNIAAGEYFFDADPGPGNGFPLAGAYGLPSLSLSGPISAVGLVAGPHWLNIRFRDEAGFWGMPQAILVNVASSFQNFIAQGEFFIDSDPGIGLATPFSQVAGSDQPIFTAPNVYTGSLSLGQHKLYARLQDSAQNWSEVADCGILIVNAPPEILRNGGCEDAQINGLIPFWDEVVGTNWAPRYTTNPLPYEGEFYFFAGAGALAELKQDVGVSGYSYGIDNGNQYFQFTGYVRSYASAPLIDLSRIVVECLDSGKGFIATAYDTGNCSNTAQWDLKTFTWPAAPGTRFIRIRLISTRQNSTNNDGYYDALSLKPLLAVSNIAPQAPIEVAIELSGSSRLVSWAPVTQDVFGNPITVSYYTISASDNPYGGFTELGQTAQTYFVDTSSNLTRRFYRIAAHYGAPNRGLLPVKMNGATQAD